MDMSERALIVVRSLETHRWVRAVERVSFLAAGEYNENFLVEADGRRLVFRINHGSQIGQEDQISYEYDVLRALESSGVTPRPLACDPAEPLLGRGVLLMEFVDGRAFDYERDWEQAADVFARLHALRTGRERFLVQERPLAAIVQESRGLLDRLPGHPLRALERRLAAYAEVVCRLDREQGDALASEPLMLVNTEVNSGNFIVGADRTWLVDWEKAVISQRYQDLAHFLAPTTTLWKTSFQFSEGRRLEFLERYRRLAGLSIPLEEVSRRTRLVEKAILLRALSWCCLVFQEYESGARSLAHGDTHERIRWYLDRAEEFLAEGDAPAAMQAAIREPPRRDDAAPASPSEPVLGPVVQRPVVAILDAIPEGLQQ